MKKVVDTAMDSSDKRNAQASEVNDSKVMILMVGMQGSEVLITPLDVEHDVDNQTELTTEELLERKTAKETFTANQAAMNKGLAALFTMYDRQLYRDSFRSFENYCFALNDMKRLTVLWQQSRLV